MRVNGIIFDLDGTLVDTIEDISAAANLMLCNHGYPVHSIDEYLNWIGNGAARLIELAVPSNLKGQSLDILVNEFKSNYSRNLNNKTNVYKGIPQLLDCLEQMTLAVSILSNKPHQLTKEVVKCYLSRWKFSFVYGQRDGIPKKPDPAAALKMAEEMGIRAEQILFVGDSKNDILTARAGGFIPVGVLWGYGKEIEILEVGADYIIHEPPELLGLLKN